MDARRVAIAGAGLSGAVLARELAEHVDLQVVVFEEKAAVGGHCYSHRDEATGSCCTCTVRISSTPGAGISGTT